MAGSMEFRYSYREPIQMIASQVLGYEMEETQ